jgi:hypothetical protein
MAPVAEMMTTAAINASSLWRHLLILFLLALPTAESGPGSAGAIELLA